MARHFKSTPDAVPDGQKEARWRELAEKVESRDRPAADKPATGDSTRGDKPGTVGRPAQARPEPQQPEATQQPVAEPVVNNVADGGQAGPVGGQAGPVEDMIDNVMSFIADDPPSSPASGAPKPSTPSLLAPSAPSSPAPSTPSLLAPSTPRANLAPPAVIESPAVSESPAAIDSPAASEAPVAYESTSPIPGQPSSSRAVGPANERASSSRRPAAAPRQLRAASGRRANQVKDIDSHGATDERDLQRVTVPSSLLRIVLTVIVIAAVGLGLVFGAPKLLEFFGPGEVESGLPVEVYIPEGSTTRQIGQILRDNQVINDITGFIDACTSKGTANYLRPGRYALTTGMDMDELINILVAGPPDNSNRLTIPEGLSIEQTAVYVEAACNIPQSEFINEAYNAAKYEAEFPFLKGCSNNSLEGFLYPKTYQIPIGASAEYVVRTLLFQFSIETAGVDWSYAESRGLSPYQVLTIASMIEKETYQADERPLVSSVIYNRLNRDMRLQIDATVIFAIGDANRDYQANPLLYSDLEFQSPYNTYAQGGLPPGPICSPQILSIQAAAAPSETEYIYYVLTSTDGRHTFCATEDEFNAAREEYDRVFGQQ